VFTQECLENIMKKFAMAAAAATFIASAAPAVAQQADTAADPFVATQGTTELAVIGAVTTLVIIAAASNGSGSSSGTD
jgi:glycine betaine/choline ABC-type transport system substrate-binding protein